MNQQQTANFFGVSVENLKRQYAENAKVMETMYTKAVQTGKKVNGYTADQLKNMVADYKQRAK